MPKWLSCPTASSANDCLPPTGSWIRLARVCTYRMGIGVSQANAAITQAIYAHILRGLTP